MIDPNMGRELDKVEEALKWATEHFSRQSEANAALHCTERVLYTPLATRLFAAQRSLTFVRSELESEPIFIPPLHPGEGPGSYIDPSSGGDV